MTNPISAPRLARPRPGDDTAGRMPPAQPTTARPSLGHDPLVCGLDDGDTPPTCPACIAAGRAKSAVAAELNHITNSFEAADRRAKQAATIADRLAAEAERAEAAAGFFWAGTALGDLFLLLLRYALRHQPDALQALLTEALRAELEPLARAVLEKGASR